MIDEIKRMAESAIDFCEKPGAKEYPEVAEAHIKGLAMMVLCSLSRVDEGEPKRPYADPTAKRRSVYLSQAVWESLQRLGNGSASAGIRKAVAQSDKLYPTCQ